MNNQPTNQVRRAKPRLFGVILTSLAQSVVFTLSVLMVGVFYITSFLFCSVIPLIITINIMVVVYTVSLATLNIVLNIHNAHLMAALWMACLVFSYPVFMIVKLKVTDIFLEFVSPSTKERKEVGHE